MLGEVKSGSGLDSSRGWDKLGFFPGTLNLLLERPLPQIEPEFHHNGFACTKGKIKGTDCYICAHDDLTRKMRVFILAAVNLRDLHGLQDGDMVTLELGDV